MWWFNLVLAATPGLVPVQGELVDGAGSPMTGTHELTFKLYASATAPGAFWSESRAVQLEGGMFSVQLGQATSLDLEQFVAFPDVFVGVAVDGAAESARLPIGSVPYAAFAAVARTAGSIDLDLASSADRASTIADLRAALDPYYDLTEAEVEAWVTNGAIDLSAGSTIGGATFGAVARSAVSGAAIDLNAASTLGGQSFAAVSRSAVSGSAIDLNAASTLGGQSFAAASRAAMAGAVVDLGAASTLGGQSFAAVSRSAVSGSAIDLNGASTLGGVAFGTAARTAVSGAAIDLNGASTLGGVAFGTAARTAVTGSALALHTGTTIAGQDVLNSDRLLARLTTEVTGRYFRLYGDEVSGTANTTAVHPNLNITGTTGNRVGSALFQMVSSWHCDYCYSGGPKALIRTAGNVPYSFCAVADDIYMYTDTTHTHRFLSSAPISPVAVASLPAGCVAIVGI
jgi:hypothetical protein